MATYGKKSNRELFTVDGRLKRLFTEVVKTYDNSIIQGHRDKVTQNRYYEIKMSKVQYPNSKHNSWPSKAVDVAPYPIDWGEEGTSEQRRKAIARFYHFAGYVLATADNMGIKVRWGGDWDMDKIFSDQKFDDLVHWELIE